MKRKSISRQTRENVYQKYGGHCAYCGCELDIKDMQVDHIEALRKYETDYEVGDADFLDNIENLMPACRMCNFYKGTYTVETFRQNLFSLHNRLEKSFIYRLAKRYGIVLEHKNPIIFYFERNGVDSNE